MKFVNPALLFGLFLIAIPVLIHLFNLRRYKIIYFSNVRFLKEIKEETRKQSRLKHLLVLLMRILAVIFIVFAFAQPYIPNSSNIIITEKDFVSVYVDNSYSMEASGMHGSLLNTAKDKAKEIVSTYRNTDEFQIINNSFSASNKRLLNKEQTSEQISEIDFTYHFRTLSQIIENQLNLVQSKDFKQKFLYIISDFQKSFVDLENIRTDTNVKIYFIPVMAEERYNIYADSCWFDAPVNLIGQNVVLKVRIKNNTDKLIEKNPIKLYLNNQQTALSSFDVNPMSETIIELPYKINETGIQNGFVELIDYPVSYDDKFYFSYFVKDVINILCLNNKNENKYVKALFGNDSAFVLNQMESRSIDYSVFPKYELIILNELDEISSGLSYELSNYIRNGGSVLLLPGRDVDVDSYNQFLTPLSEGTIDKSENQMLKINKINFSHPLYKDVFEKLPENINLPEVKKHYVLKTSSTSLSDDILNLQNGHPFLSIFYVDKGFLYVLAAPLDKDFSNFQSHAVFVPTLYNMALNSIKSSDLYYLLGNDISFNYYNADTDLKATYKIKNAENDFEFIPQFSNAFSYITFYINEQIKEAGNYLLNYKDVSRMGISFNYNRKESDLSCYDKTELSELIKQKNLKNINIIDARQETITSAITKINQGFVLWKYCIIFALLFLAVEIILLRYWK